MAHPCQPSREWVDGLALKRCAAYVLKMQRRLDEVVSDNDQDRIRHITYLLSRRSEAVRIVAIERVTRTNGGKHTAGIDGVATPRDSQEADRFRRGLLENLDMRKRPSAIRRVFIPKSNGKLRPLGIPTIMDRVIQDILRIAIEPICEYHFLDCSYGFRPKRCCQDAIEHIFNKTAPGNRGQWIIEGDIKGCFDHISHRAIVWQMDLWQIPRFIRGITGRMLKAGILDENGHVETTMGTPQGGILSPLLANIALTVLDQWGASQRRTNPLVRYADDFIVVTRTKEEAQQKTNQIGKLLRERLGLELSVEKTRITHIHDGFDFLGFHIRKYRHQSPHSKYHATGQLLITPQKEKVIQFLTDCNALIRAYRGRSLYQLLLVLNPKVQGFAHYYRFGVSQKTFGKISYEIFHQVYRWLCRSHPGKSAQWVMKRYLIAYDPVKKTQTFHMNGVRLYQPQFMPIKRFRQIKSGRRVYDNGVDARVYWQQRAYTNGLLSIYSIRVEKLYKRQQGYCPLCRRPINGEQIRDNHLHIHHLNPEAKRGDHRLSNLRLLHDDCHSTLHRILSLEEMNRLTAHKIDYCQKDELYKMVV